MEPAIELKKLCETWWDRLMDSTKGEQHRFAEHFLRLLGWEAPARIEVVDANAVSARPAAASYILRGGAQSALAAHFVMPGSLEPPTSLVERGLDFCETTRYLVDATRSLHVNYVLVTDLYRSYLYDSRTEELLLYSNTPADFTREFGTTLTQSDVERGALEEIRRQPRSYIARQLREWCHRWCETMMVETRQPEETASLLIDRLLVLRYLMEHEILKRPGWRLRPRFLAVLRAAGGANGHGCGKLLLKLFQDLWRDWKVELFAPRPGLDEVLDKDSLTGPLLRELNLLARTKFTIATVLESFNYGEATEKARVRMIPEDNPEREEYLQKITAAGVDEARIVVDLEDEGYRAIFHWFDQLIAVYDRLEAAADLETARRDVLRLQAQDDLDLFAWSELDANRPQAISDKVRHAIEHGLGLYYGTRRQYRTSRLILHLYLIDRYEQSRYHVVAFPRVEAALTPRPRMTEADRKRLFEPPPERSEWEAI
ncbi:MAG: hypothetical protein HY706_10770 [Candidatus Hydrogenedentes bacterium]|nr:hypothetical protein [Candidatus Hydrogenedentota bacterium]